MEKKIFLLLVALAIAARIFTVFVLPDEALNDALVHLTIVQKFAETGVLPFAEYPTILPLFYYAAAPLFILLGLPINASTAFILPLVITIAQLLIAFVLFKELFPKQWFLGLAFVAAQPLLIIYGAVNYTGPLATVFVLLATYLLVKYVKTSHSGFLIALPFAIAGIALSKLNATILVPAFFIAGVAWLWKSRACVKLGNRKLVYFVVATFLLSTYFFALMFLGNGQLFGAEISGISSAPSGLAEKFTPLDAVLLPFYFNFAFWYFPTADLLGNTLIADVAPAFFTLFSFPLLLLVFYGFGVGLKSKSTGRKQLFWFLALVFILALVPLLARQRRGIYIRMLLPALPLLGIAFSQGWIALKEKFSNSNLPVGKILLLLFSLVVLYSVALSSYSAIYFNESFQKHKPLYDYISTLPEDAAVIIHSNKFRAVEFFGQRQGFGFDETVLLEGAETAVEVYEVLKKNGITHLAATCYKNPWEEELILELFERGYLKTVYSDDCSTLYKIE